MNGIVLGRCTDCDSEYFFMDGSRCAACLSALQTGAQDVIEIDSGSDAFSSDAEQPTRRDRAA